MSSNISSIDSSSLIPSAANLLAFPINLSQAEVSPEGGILIEVVKAHRRSQSESQKTYEDLLKCIEELKNGMKVLAAENATLNISIVTLEGNIKESSTTLEALLQSKKDSFKKKDDLAVSLHARLFALPHALRVGNGYYNPEFWPPRIT